MNATQASTTFSRSVYRDFALFALAAIGVGLAISLTLATAVVLAAPDGAAAAATDKAPARQAAGPKTHRTRFAAPAKVVPADVGPAIASIQHSEFPGLAS